MVVERSWILGVLACALAAPTACGGISVSHGNGGEAGEGANGGSGANGGTGGIGGNGSGAGPGAGGGGTGGGGGAGGVSPSGGTFGGTTPVGGSIQAGGSGGVSTGGKGGKGGGGKGMGASGGVMPMGGVGGTTPVPDTRIPWDENGFISYLDNAFGIQGSWYFATDCGSTSGTGLECTKPDPSLVGPDNSFGWATWPERVCMRGIAPQITNNPATGMPAYDLQWGALFGFNLADGGAYDADVYGVRGFQFDMTANFESRIRANVVSTTTLGISHFVEISLPSPGMTVLFSDALQGAWVINQSPLDTSQLTSFEFHVYTNVSATTPFDICISNLRAVMW